MSHGIHFENRRARHVIISDVTDKRWVMRALNEKNKTLKHAQEIAKMGSWQYDYITKEQIWSDNNFRLYGLEPGEIKPIHEYALSRIHPDDINTVQETLNSAIKRKEKNITGEFRITFQDDSIKWIYTSAILIYQNEHLTRIEGINVDITERKQFEQELIDAKNKAQESEQLKSAFLANMSHEIRTPMSGILGFLDLLNDKSISYEEEMLYKDLVKKSGNRLMDTINDIIQLSQIEAGQLNVSIEKIDIIKELKYFHQFFEMQAKEKGLKLVLSVPENSYNKFVNTDKAKFGSIVSNLIKNAIKFTFKGTIELGYKMDGALNVFFVKDTGAGIPGDRINAIFDRFVQASLKISRPHEGSGLGLSIAKAFVEMLGGKIWVESEENVGSTFYFTLNQVDLKKIAESIKHVEIPADEKNDTIEKEFPTILVAEDDETNWKFIETILTKENYFILRATNGIEAVRLTKENPDLDLVLMDIKMPLMDGYEATLKIREFNKNIAIIAQTAYAMIGDKEKTIAAGCNDYLAKPLNKEILLQKIRLALKVQSKIH